MKTTNNDQGHRAVLFGSVMLRLYGLSENEMIRSAIRAWVIRMEGGAAYSLTIREIFRKFHRVEVGLFTAGPCRMRPNVFHPGTKIGRYSSIDDTVRTFTRNHPMNLKSTHGFFYNPALKKVRGGPIRFNSLTIGNGVCIGHNAIILYPTERIGDGAVICPGSVVYTNVPPYAVVSGFPARVTGFLHSKQVIDSLLNSEWWEKGPEELESMRESLHSHIGAQPAITASAGEGRDAFGDSTKTGRLEVPIK